MIQPNVEKTLAFRLKEKVSIDNMTFTVNSLDVQKHLKEGDYHVTIWGRKPKATTLALGRVIKIDDLFFKPTKITLLTRKGNIADFRINEEIESIITDCKNKKDKIVSVLVEMNTALNETIHYSWS